MFHFLRQNLNEMPTPSKLLFLPGASGDTTFWQPVAESLAHGGTHVHMGWPGFGSTPSSPDVSGISDLVPIVLAEIDQPVAIVGQSIGSVIATMAALERPDLVTHLVLAVTSGGINVADLGAQDWRPEFFAAHPTHPRWIGDFKTDLTSRLGAIRIPTLLLWGDADPISPVAVGKRLATLLPNAKLHIFAGGTHDLAHARAAEVAPLIDAHLAKTD
jgi:pimeloyl-ACP methyl ester carboxylesterase